MAYPGKPYHTGSPIPAPAYIVPAPVHIPAPIHVVAPTYPAPIHDSHHDRHHHHHRHGHGHVVHPVPAPAVVYSAANVSFSVPSISRLPSFPRVSVGVHPPPHVRPPVYVHAAPTYETHSQGQPLGAAPAYGGYQPAPGFNTQQGTTTVITVPQAAQPATVVYAGGCPTCRSGSLDEEFSLCGIIWAIVCFPIGLICCLTMRQRRCTNCGSTFG